MKPLTSATRPVSVERVAVIEVVVAEIVAVDDRPAVGDVGVVVVDHPMAMPVAPPVMPTPTISSKKADSKADPESNPHSSHEDTWFRIPAWIRDNRPTVHEPGIIGRYVDDFRIGRFDDDGVSLSRYLFLFIGIEVAGPVSLLTHDLDGVCHILLLVGVRIAKRGSPGEVLVHVFKDRGKLCECLDARVPGLFVNFFCQLLTLEFGMALHPPVRLDNFSGIGGSGENLRNECVRV